MKDLKSLKGNNKVASSIFFFSLLLVVILIKPILFGVFWLVVSVLQGVLAFVAILAIGCGGFYLFRIEKWAFLTRFTKKNPEFPDLSVDWFQPVEADFPPPIDGGEEADEEMV